MNFLICVIIALALLLMYWGFMIALSMPMAMKIKKVKCPGCKRKVWAGRDNLRRVISYCQQKGLCALEKVVYEMDCSPLAALLSAPEKKEEEAILVEGEYEFEFSDPLVIHIVDKETRYINE